MICQNALEILLLFHFVFYEYLERYFSTISDLQNTSKISIGLDINTNYNIMVSLHVT